MEASHSAPTKLYHMFKGVSVFMDHVNFVYDKTGLSFSGMDASHVSLIDVVIGLKEWTDYRLKYGVSGSFGISVKQLVKVLSHTTGSDTIVFKYDSNSPKLTLDLEVNGKDRDFNVSLPTIEIDEDSLEIPSGLEYGFQMKLIPSVFDGYINSMSVIDPYTVSFHPKRGKTEYINMTGEGDMAPMSMTVRSGKPFKSDEPMSARKDLTRYTTIMKADCDDFEVPLNPSILSNMKHLSRSMISLEINLDKGLPALFKYSFGDSLKVGIFVAPKMLDDCDD